MTRTVRPLTLAEIETLLDWAAAEGWNPGLHDAAAFQAADPQGFFGTFVDGVMVAGISAVAYDDHFGFIGLYICHPNWRGQGHGKAAWDAGVAYLGNRTIGLDGVAEQQANYAKMGFVAAYETIRMSGAQSPPTSTERSPTLSVDDVSALDRQCFPAPRQAFLQRWLSLPNLVLARVSEGELSAYGVARSCREGSKIGPLFATSLDAATSLLDRVPGLVSIDVPSVQTEWLSVLEERGFSAGFTTQRMYRGSQPEVNLARIFGISSLELG
nr:GNAT family N-acetyltransferase [uncultured Devosia sp.]